jgi:hypothetical protein
VASEARLLGLPTQIDRRSRSAQVSDHQARSADVAKHQALAEARSPKPTRRPAEQSTAGVWFAPVTCCH